MWQCSRDHAGGEQSFSVLVVSFYDWLIGWLVGWMVGWTVGWLVGWMVGWLVGWLDVFFFA